MPNRGERRVESHRHAFDRNRAGHAGAGAAKEGREQRGPSRAHGATDGQDLAAPYRKRYVRNDEFAGGAFFGLALHLSADAMYVEALHRENRRARSRADLRRTTATHLSTDHLADH